MTKLRELATQEGGKKASDIDAKLAKLDEICARCGAPKRYHFGLNFADGTLVSGAVLICPTATYMETP